MIYPEYFPEDRKEEFAEQKVFDQLKRFLKIMMFFTLENLSPMELVKNQNMKLILLLRYPKKQ